MEIDVLIVRIYFKLNFDAFTIDFLPELPGLSKFRNAYEQKEIVAVEEVEMPFINIDDLITNNRHYQGKKALLI